MLVDLVKNNNVKNLSKVKMKASIARHVEWSYIYFEFSDYFKVEDIPDDVIINMLDNIENRLYRFSGSDNFVIIHRISDSKIMK